MSITQINAFKNVPYDTTKIIDDALREMIIAEQLPEKSLHIEALASKESAENLASIVTTMVDDNDDDT